jgi:hypothetical protein
LVTLWVADMKIKEPNIQQRIIVLITDFALDPLKRNVSFIRSAFQYLLDTKASLLTSRTITNVPQFDEDTKELHRFTSHQLQRFALKAADHLIVSTKINCKNKVNNFNRNPLVKSSRQYRVYVNCLK